MQIHVAYRVTAENVFIQLPLQNANVVAGYNAPALISAGGCGGARVRAPRRCRRLLPAARCHSHVHQMGEMTGAMAKFLLVFGMVASVHQVSGCLFWLLIALLE